MLPSKTQLTKTNSSHSIGSDTKSNPDLSGQQTQSNQGIPQPSSKALTGPSDLLDLTNLNPLKGQLVQEIGSFLFDPNSIVQTDHDNFNLAARSYTFGSNAVHPLQTGSLSGPQSSQKSTNPTVNKLLNHLKLDGDFEQSIFAKSIDGGKYEDVAQHLEEQYESLVEELTTTLEGLEEGQFGVRWQFMDFAQKAAVAARIATAMIPTTEILIKEDGDGYDATENDMSDYFDQDNVDEMAMVHGSYVWGESSHTPGDLDLMIRTSIVDVEKSYDPEDYFGSDSPNIENGGDITVGTKFLSESDHILNIPLLGNRPDVRDVPVKTEWEAIQKNLRKLISTGHKELSQNGSGKNGKDTQGAGHRKQVAAAVLLDHIYHKATGEHHPKLVHIIKQDNAALISGKKIRDNFNDLLSGAYQDIDSLVNELSEVESDDDDTLYVSDKMETLLEKYNKTGTVQGFLKDAHTAGVTKELNSLDDQRDLIEEQYPDFAAKYWD